MYTINNLNVFSDSLEGATLNQMYTAMDHEWVVRGALLPDAHVGYGLPIGGVVSTQDVVVPSWVGYDIGCFTGDVEVRLINGDTNSFIDMYNNNVSPFVFCCDTTTGKIKVQQATVVKTRTVEEVIEVTLDNNEVFCCTTDHKFLMRKGLTYKSASDLMVDDSLAPLYLFEDVDGYLLCQHNLLQGTGNKGEVWDSVHKLVADEYGIFDQSITKACIHHVDRNRKNNHPNNLQCMSTSAHMSLHGKDRGWFKTEVFKAQRKKKLEENGYYDPTLYDKKKDVALVNMVKLQSSERYKRAIKGAGERGKKNFRNTDPDFIQKQQEARIVKILNECMQIHGTISLEVYNSIAIKYYRSPSYNKALARIQQGGYISFEDFFTSRNHKVIAVRKIVKTQDVFCLHVPKYHNFALASGVFVHNCGVGAIRTSFKVSDIASYKQEIYARICETVPLGVGVYRKKSVMSVRQMHDSFKLECSDFMSSLIDQKAVQQCGSLGSGNHFCEIGYDEDENVWAIVHSGSRGIGHACATRYMQLAQPNTGSKEGSFPLDVNSVDGADYIKDLAFMLEFALTNRAIILNDMLNAIYFCVNGSKEKPFVYVQNKYLQKHDERCTMFVNRNHNHAELKDGLWVHRKGATHAEDGMLGVIPGNMRDGSFIVKGKGSDASLCSSSHGAGRVLGRKQAKRELDPLDFIATMKDVVCGVSNDPGGLLDEAPAAYKDIFTVMEEQKDLVEVVEHVRPLINVKR